MDAFSSEFFESLQPASFAGVVFGVESFDGAGGHQVAEQTAVGVGARVLRRALTLQSHSFRGYLSALVGAAREPRDVLRDFAELERAANDPQPQTLVHPWKGALASHLCTSFSPTIMTAQVRSVRIDMTFAPATFPEPVPQPVDVPETGSDARLVMVSQSGAFAGEGIAFGEVELSAEALGTTGATDADTARATTAKLLEDANLQASGVPGVIQRIGQATRVVDAGQYTIVARTRLYADVLNVASARNSATLLNLLATFQLLLSDLGGGALASSVDVTTGSLQSLAVVNSLDPRVLASRNRDTVRGWFPRGTVQL